MTPGDRHSSLDGLGSLAGPAAVTPARRPGSVRRTTNVDIVWRHPQPGGFFRAHDSDTQDAIVLELGGAARDLLTTTEGAAVVLGEASVHAGVDGQRHLRSLALTPALPDGDTELLGCRVGPGFRGRAEAAQPTDWRGGPAALLLDDLPVAALISGYATIRSEALGGRQPGELTPASVLDQMLDLCSGWRAGGTMAQSLAAGRGMPMQDCPPAPAPDPDAGAWHAMPVISSGSMRRRRRIDVVTGSGGLIVDAMFRDTYVEPDGGEVVLHEYRVDAEGDAAGVIQALHAEPLVLPFGECPAAAEHVTRLLGSPFEALRGLVGDALTGTTSCTHLNDLLRTLADVPWLAGRLEAEAR